MDRYQAGPVLRRTAMAVAVAAFCCTVPTALAAPGDPVGGSIQVSPTGVGSTINTYGDTLDVASDAAGNFTVVWASHNFDCTDNCKLGQRSMAILGQRVAANGALIGGHFAAAPDLIPLKALSDIKENPRVAMDAAGDFVVVWDEYIVKSARQVKAQRFAADGTAQGAEILVAADGMQPSVAMEPDGDFVVAWGDDVTFDLVFPRYSKIGGQLNLLGSSSAHARRYHANGVAAVAGSGLRQQRPYVTAPEVGAAADGSFVVSWVQGEYGTYTAGEKEDGTPIAGTVKVLAQRYTPGGLKQGAQIQLNTLPNLIPDALSLAMDSSGEFLAAWSASGQQYLRAYRGDGTPRTGAESLVETVLSSFPRLAANAAGNFALGEIVDNFTGQPPPLGEQIYVILLRADGTPLSTARSLLPSVPTFADAPVALDASGNAVIAGAVYSSAANGGPIWARRVSGH